MHIDEYYAAAKTSPVVWDEIREQRVFGRIRDETKKRVRMSRPKTERWRAAALAAGLAVVVVAAYLFGPGGRGEKFSQTPPAGSTPGQPEALKTPRNTPSLSKGISSILGLQDAGRVVLYADAAVSVESRTDLEIRLSHAFGKARYEINRKRGRRVLITIESIRVEVVGTRFTIDRTSSAMRIQVEEGTVRVTQQKREMLLNAGEALELFLSSKRASVAEPEATVQRKPRGRSAPAKRIPSKEAGTEHAPASLHTADALFALVDRERAAGNLEQAAAYLGEIIASDASASKKVTAQITLGRIRRQQGRHKAAAAVFCGCASQYPSHPLAEDALAECAKSQRDAGDAAGAAAAASAYRSRYPDGVHRHWLRGLLE